MARKPPNPLTLCEIEQIKVLKASGLSYYAVAKKVGRDSKTVKRCCIDPRNADEIKDIQRELASYFEDLSMRLITSISDEDILGLSAYQRVIAAGISVDKLRLLRNESTENISIDVIRSRREDTQKRLEELRREREKMTGVDEDVEQEKHLALEDKTHNPIDDVEKVIEIANED